MYEINRPATVDEIRTYHIVNEYAETLNETEYSAFLDKVSLYAWAWNSDERRKAYNALRSTAKRIGVTVADLGTWYCVEEV